MDKVAFILAFTTIFAITAIVLLGILKRVRDETLILTLLLSEFLFLPTTGTQLELKHLYIPILAAVILLRRKISTNSNYHRIVYLLPYFVYFFVAFCWFFENGMLPNLISGNSNSNSGNFIVFYNIFCNFCVLLIGFYSRIQKKIILKIIRFLGFLLSFQVLLIFLNKAAEIIYIPILMPSGNAHLIKAAFGEMNRDGVLSHYCYLAALFLSTSRKNVRRIAILVLIIVNLIFGGGRTDLLALIMVGLATETLGDTSVVKTGFKLVSVTALILISISIGTIFMSNGQLKRFSAITNPSKSEELDRDRNGRMAMWLYSINEFQKRPIFGNGISKQNYVGNRRSVAIRNVELGSSHQFYLSVLYAFGLLGFVPLLTGFIAALRMLLKSREGDVYGLVNFVIILLITYVFIQFMINGGVKKLFILFFLFLGMVPQLCKIPTKSKI